MNKRTNEQMNEWTSDFLSLSLSFFSADSLFLKIMNINQPPTDYEGDMSGQFAVSDETFHQTLIAKQLPLSFDERLWLAHRELVIVEQILGISKLSLDHPIYTYQLDSDSDTYRKLIHFRSLLKKKDGNFRIRICWPYKILFCFSL